MASPFCCPLVAGQYLVVLPSCGLHVAQRGHCRLTLACNEPRSSLPCCSWLSRLHDTTGRSVDEEPAQRNAPPTSEVTTRKHSPQRSSSCCQARELWSTCSQTETLLYSLYFLRPLCRNGKAYIVFPFLSALDNHLPRYFDSGTPSVPTASLAAVRPGGAPMNLSSSFPVAASASLR